MLSLRALAAGALVPGAILAAPLAANAASYHLPRPTCRRRRSAWRQLQPGSERPHRRRAVLRGGRTDQSDPTQDPTFQPGSSGLLDATSFTFTETGSTVDAINQNYGAGFTQDNIGDWTAIYTTNAQGAAYQVEFVAPAGDTLASGNQFFTTVDFANAPPAGFTYSITYGGDAVSAAPEPSVWLLMISGLGAIGGALRLGRPRALTTAAA